MPLPFVLAGAAVAAGLYGVKKGVDAKNSFDDAERYARYAKEESEEANKKLDKQKRMINLSLDRYGLSKKRGMELIDKFGSFICYPNEERKNGQLRVGKNYSKEYPKIIITEEEEIKILQDLNILDKNISFKQAREKIKAKNVDMEKMSSALASIAGGTLVGVAAGGGAYLGVGAFAAASTGTAISSLSGAAATNATLAWLGGGSLASGGLGMTGGLAVLGGAVAGPLLAIGGAVMAAKAAEKADEAYAILSRVRADIKKLDGVISKLNSIERYTDECYSTLNKLNGFWKDGALSQLEMLAERNVTFKELSAGEKTIIYLNYELNYTIYDFINEPVINEAGDDVLPHSERKALKKAHNAQHFSIS